MYKPKTQEKTPNSSCTATSPCCKPQGLVGCLWPWPALAHKGSTSLSCHLALGSATRLWFLTTEPTLCVSGASMTLTPLSLTTSFTGEYRHGQSSVRWEGSQSPAVNNPAQSAEQAVLGLSWKRLWMSPVKGRDQKQFWRDEKERKINH